MARMRVALLVVAVALLSLSSLSNVEAQSSSAPAPAPDCTVILAGLVPSCFGYLTNDSIPTVPKNCCIALDQVFETTPVCLCDFISPLFANQTAGLGINQTRALGLPSICKISANPSECASLTGQPVAAPVPSVTGSPAAAPGPTSPGVSLECQSQLLPLRPCIPFATGTASTPTTDCCTDFRSVLHGSPDCLCPFLEGKDSIFSGVNVSGVASLPNLCNVSDVQQLCLSASSGPGGAPGSSATTAITSPLVTFALVAATILAFCLQ